MSLQVMLLLFICMDSTSSFPLKTCNLDKKEILFMIDCRYEVIEQIDFINQTVDYLRNRNWTQLDVYYITLTDKEPVELLMTNISEKATEISDHCNGTFFNEEMILVIKKTMIPKPSTLTIKFVLLNVYHTEWEVTDEIFIRIDKQDKQVTFFILNDVLNNGKHKILEMFSRYVFSHYVNSFQNLSFASLFPRICDFKCTSTNLRFDSHNFQRSFYRVELSSISHDSAATYCSEQFNSYLVSIETFEELDYLISELVKINKSSWKYPVPFRMYLGLNLKDSIQDEFDLRNIFWSSGNPFTFYHEISLDYKDVCAHLIYTRDVNDTMTFKDRKSIWKYLHFNKCDQVFKDVYVICECHQQLETEVDWVIKPLSKPDTSNLIFFHSSLSLLYISGLNDLITVNKLNCTSDGYLPYEENYFFCSSKIATSKIIFVSAKILQESHDHRCTSHCLDYFSVVSENNTTSAFIKSEEFCYKKKLFDCPSDKVYIVSGLPLVPCKTNVGFSPKCLKLYHFTCIDQSHLQNCENFQCPDGFLKCPNSYCIPIETASHTRESQCPLSQEKLIFTQNNRICVASIKLKLKKMCIPVHYLQKHNTLIPLFQMCNLKCPHGYECYFRSRRTKLSDLLTLNTALYNISNSLLPDSHSNLFLPYVQIKKINVQSCKVTNINTALQHWNTEEIVILDISKNLLSNSDYLSSIKSMTTLLYLNMSYNYKLTLSRDFTLPNSLEVIDLSFTSIESLPVNCFKNLTHLRLLNLRNTLIHTFDNMGLPPYFKLDILNIQDVTITDVQADFFKGLTINSSLWSSDFRLCCPQILGNNIPPEKCHAPDDAITSCKNIVGDQLKRILVWVVGLMTIVGNGIVLIYRVVWSKEKIFQTAYGLFVTGLAVSDLLMGVYLMIIAAVDMIYADVYVVYDESWRSSDLCQFSGFLSTLSSETSTFLIGLITLDRYINISYPFSAHDTSTSLKWKCFISSWIIGFILALIPAVVPGWQIYSSNGLCLALPLSTTGSDKLPGWEFSMAVYVILNFVLFLFIALGQVGIFVNVIKNRNQPSTRHCSERRTQDMNIAKKLAFVAVSDFLCWFPIGILGILSLVGQEFDKETYAWIAVFVLPVNSALNPMIYTIPVIINKLTSHN